MQLLTYPFHWSSGVRYVLKEHGHARLLILLEVPRAMKDLAQLFGSLEELLQLFNLFHDCDSSGKGTILEKAEHPLRDVVYLEPILPEGESIMKTLSDVVVCMREEIEADGVQQYIENRGLGRPSYDISREQLVFLLEHGFTQCAIATMMGCSARTINRRISDFQLYSYISFSDIEDQFLDMAVKDVQIQYPNWGEKAFMDTYIQQELRFKDGIYVSQCIVCVH